MSAESSKAAQSSGDLSSPADSAVPSTTTGPSTLSSTAASSRGDGRGRMRFEPFELAMVLSHYDLGVIQSIQEFPRGSRRAPKLRLRTERGTFLLKRRARGKDDPAKVAFCHRLQLHLTQRQFPLPQLIRTRADNHSMLQCEGRIYELFEYIKGSSYDSSLEATTDAGKALALFHKLARQCPSEDQPPAGAAYHGARSVLAAMQQVPQTLSRLEPETGDEQQRRQAKLVRFLRTAYKDAATRVDELGLPDWPQQIIHSDWHPGNMLFRGSRVVAVIDYDAARVQPRIIDAANGALQFSILSSGEDPRQWPDYLDQTRFKRFLRGYDSVPDAMLSRAELRTVPWLMIEALIAESVIPIAATGSFARLGGPTFLHMVARKVRWLQKHADDLIRGLEA